MIIHPCACLFVYLVVSLFVFLLAGLSALSVCLVRPFVCPTVCLSALPSVCPSVCSSLFRSPYLSICLSIDLSKVCLYVRLPAYQCPTKSVGPFSSYKTHATHNSCIRSDDELMFGMTIYENCTVANLHYQIS